MESILIIEEFSPSVSRTPEKIIEALIILHKIREDMLLSILLQVLHIGEVYLDFLLVVICSIRNIIILNLFGQYT